jgi:hypothetical protein
MERDKVLIGLNGGFELRGNPDTFRVEDRK